VCYGVAWIYDAKGLLAVGTEFVRTCWNLAGVRRSHGGREEEEQERIEEAGEEARGAKAGWPFGGPIRERQTACLHRFSTWSMRTR